MVSYPFRAAGQVLNSSLIGAPFTVYFWGEFSQPADEAQTFSGVNTDPMPRYQTHANGGISEPTFGNKTHKATSGPMNHRVGALFSWSDRPASHVISRVGISTISTERARSYIETEIPSWDLQETVADAIREWNEDVFNKISVPLGDSANMTHVRLLYSSLYFIHLMPSDRTGENPLWESDEPYWDDFYTMCTHHSLSRRTNGLTQARGHFPLHSQLLPHLPARVLRVHDQSSH